MFLAVCYLLKYCCVVHIFVGEWFLPIFSVGTYDEFNFYFWLLVTFCGVVVGRRRVDLSSACKQSGFPTGGPDLSERSCHSCVCDVFFCMDVMLVLL